MNWPVIRRGAVLLLKQMPWPDHPATILPSEPPELVPGEQPGLGAFTSKVCSRCSIPTGRPLGCQMRTIAHFVFISCS